MKRPHSFETILQYPYKLLTQFLTLFPYYTTGCMHLKCSEFDSPVLVLLVTIQNPCIWNN